MAATESIENCSIKYKLGLNWLRIKLKRSLINNYINLNNPTTNRYQLDYFSEWGQFWWLLVQHIQVDFKAFHVLRNWLNSSQVSFLFYVYIYIYIFFMASKPDDLNLLRCHVSENNSKDSQLIRVAVNLFLWPLFGEVASFLVWGLVIGGDSFNGWLFIFSIVWWDHLKHCSGRRVVGSLSCVVYKFLIPLVSVIWNDFSVNLVISLWKIKWGNLLIDKIMNKIQAILQILI